MKWSEPHLRYIKVNDHSGLAHPFTVCWGTPVSTNCIVIESANGLCFFLRLVNVSSSTGLSRDHKVISVIHDNKVTIPSGDIIPNTFAEHRTLIDTKHCGDNHSLTFVYKPNYSVQFDTTVRQRQHQRQHSNSTSCVIWVCSDHKVWHPWTSDNLPMSLGPIHARYYSWVLSQISSCSKFHHSGFGKDE